MSSPSPLHPSASASASSSAPILGVEVETGGEAGPSTPAPKSTNPKSNGRTKSKSENKDKAKPKPRTKPIPQPISAFQDPSVGEEETVHEIYESIAPHFALTRHKPWPLITSFLTSLPPNSLGLDSGAGNGKYLPTAYQCGHTMIALDRSLGLLGLAKMQEGGGDCVRGDLGGRGWRDGVFDFTISVAAIHHLSTPQRRRQAVQAILPTLNHRRHGPYSKFFIYVWAYEQGGMSKREMGSASANANANAPKEHEHEHELAREREHEHELAREREHAPEHKQEQGQGQGQGQGQEGQIEGITEEKHQPGSGGGSGHSDKRIQDVLVPWVLKSNPKPKPSASSSSSSSLKDKTKKKSKSSTGPDQNTSTSTSTENENENETIQDNQDDQNREADGGKEEEEGDGEKVYHRYYHLFVRGELRNLVYQAGVEEGYRIIPPSPSSSSSSEVTSDIPISSLSLSISSTPNATSTSTSTSPTKTKEDLDQNENGDVLVLGEDDRWLMIKGEGWEADNWWVEVEVGLGPVRS